MKYVITTIHKIIPVILFFQFYNCIQWIDIMYGFGFQSCIEYIGHFSYHKILPHEHTLHHKHPLVFGSTPNDHSLLVSCLLVMVLFLVYLSTNINISVTTYFWYIWIEYFHYLCHTQSLVVPSTIKRLHDIHHTYPNKNYGIFGGLLFDILFGTFQWK